MTSRLPVNLMAPILIALPVLLLGVWLSTMWYEQSKQAVANLADQKISQIHDLVTLKIADAVAIPPRVCQLNEYLVHSGILDPDDLESWRPTFYKELSAFDMLSAITWGSEDGRSAWVARYVDGKTYWGLKEDASVPTMREWLINESGDISDTWDNSFEFDLFSRPWYITPREEGGPAWSPPYVWAGGQDSEAATLGISYGRPIYKPDGQLLGIIDTDISLNDLSGFLQSIPIGTTGVAILASSDGQLLAASNNVMVVSEAGSLSKVSISSDSMIARIGQAIEQETASQNYNATIQLNEEPHYMRLSAAGLDVGLDWRLGTIIPESDFLREVEDQFYRSLILSLAIVVIVVIFAWATFRWLLDPLLKLIKALKYIGQGELNTRVNLGTTSEYVKLGHAINDMTENLQQSHQKEVLLRHELDHRVKNMLAQIVALCQQTATQSTTDRVLIDNLASRVASLSGVHELLGDRDQLGLPLVELVTQCAAPYISKQEFMQISGPMIFVRPKAAMCLSLIVNELATNSCKHGALSRDDGLIDVTWQVLDQSGDDARIEFEWIETRGKAPTGKIRQGFGTKVLEELIPYEIAGTADLNFTPKGLHYTASIPIKFFMSMNKA